MFQGRRSARPPDVVGDRDEYFLSTLDFYKIGSLFHAGNFIIVPRSFENIHQGPVLGGNQGAKTRIAMLSANLYDSNEQDASKAVSLPSLTATGNSGISLCES